MHVYVSPIQTQTGKGIILCVWMFQRIEIVHVACTSVGGVGVGVKRDSLLTTHYN